jgi:serine/threonine protein kinase
LQPDPLNPSDDDTLSQDDAQFLDSSVAHLAKLDEQLRSGSIPLSPSKLNDSRELLLLQLEQRWPRQRPSASATMDERTVQIGPYTIDRELGRGGFGVVMLASDTRDSRQVALKVPRPEILMDPSLRERFRREATAVAGFEHPNVIAVYEVGSEGPIDYLANEYCSRGSLADALASGTLRLTPRQSAALVKKLAEAVAHIHSQDVLHRDIKPSNVLLGDKFAADDSSIDADTDDLLDFRPLVTDFGLAKMVDQSLFETGSSLMMGSPLYMAPEQAACQSSRIGAWTDVYSLGVILYELLTGRPPFEGPGLVAVLTQLQTTDPRRPLLINASLPRDLDIICMKCMAKEPTARYQTATELAQDLGRYLANQPIIAKPPTITERAMKWCRQPQRITDSGRAAILVGVAFLLWFSFAIPYAARGGHLNVDGKSVALGGIMVAFTFIFPLIVLGILILTGRRWPIWIGVGVLFGNTIFCLVGLAGWSRPFGGLYDLVPYMRVAMFGMVGSITLLLTLSFIAAAIASHHERER